MAMIRFDDLPNVSVLELFREFPHPKAAPNNYRSDRVSGDPSVIARRPLRRSNPGAPTCGAAAIQTAVASLAMTDRELAHLFLRVA